MKQNLLFVLIISMVSCHLKQDNNKLDNIVTLPSFNMLLLDSTTLFNSNNIPKGEPILVLYFRPDCPHCKQETKDFIDNMALLKKYNFYFLSGAPLEEIRFFSQKYQLSQYSNITIGKDHNSSFRNIFKPTSIPYLALYNGEKKLVKIYSEGVTTENILKTFHS